MHKDRRLAAARTAAAEYRASLGADFEASALGYAAGQALMMAGQPEAALARWLEALDAPTARGWPVMMNAMVAAAQALDTLEDLAQAFSERAQRLPELLLWEGYTLRLAGRPEAALGPLARAEAVHEGEIRYTASTERLRALVDLGRLEEAVAVCVASAQAQPAFGLSFEVSRAGLLARLGQAEAALALLEAVLARSPGYADAHVNRGGLLVRMGRVEEGRAALEMATRLNPGLAGEARRLGG
ncbi:MAG: tetratricopeptide repeat protein [Alphaproteobacteria bacterium]|nr:tetratricopeptide repeat protein [Alphaproteobacteria bacterium]